MASKTYGAGYNPLAVDPDAIRDPVWDDLLGNPGANPFFSANNPTWTDYNLGIGGGVDYRVLGFGLNDTQSFTFQSRHAAKLNNACKFHIHYCTPNDGTGDSFQFQADVIACPVNGSFAAVAGSPFMVETLMAADYSNTQRLVSVATIPAVNSGVSTLYLIRLTRIAVSVGSEYASNIYVLFADMHFELDAEGSRQEFVK